MNEKIERSPFLLYIHRLLKPPRPQNDGNHRFWGKFLKHLIDIKYFAS
jgi:hypothetical protein